MPGIGVKVRGANSRASYLLSFLFAFFTSLAAVFLPFAILFFAALLAFFTAVFAFFTAFLAFFTVRLALRRTTFSSARAAATVLFVAATTLPKVVPTVSATFINASFDAESFVVSLVFSLVVSSDISLSWLYLQPANHTPIRRAPPSLVFRS
jgi:hypothetical protein